MRQCTYLYASCQLISAVFRCFLNVSFSSTVLMPPGTLFQLMGPWVRKCSLSMPVTLLTISYFNNIHGVILIS